MLGSPLLANHLPELARGHDPDVGDLVCNVQHIAVSRYEYVGSGRYRGRKDGLVVRISQPMRSKSGRTLHDRECAQKVE